MIDLTPIKPTKVRTLSDYKDFLFNFLPIGILWEVMNDKFQLLMEAFAEEFNRNDQRNVDLQVETIPGLSVELLPQWEKDVLLPEEYPGPFTTISERQLRVHTKLFNTPNNPTKQFFIDLAADRGIDITITTVTGAFRVGVNRCGDRIRGYYSPFFWVVDYVSGSTSEYNALKSTFYRLSPAWELLIFHEQP